MDEIWRVWYDNRHDGYQVVRDKIFQEFGYELSEKEFNGLNKFFEDVLDEQREIDLFTG